VIRDSFDIEQGVLGAYLLEPERCMKKAIDLKPEDFYTTLHQDVFYAVQMLYPNNPVDMLSVAEYIKTKMPSKSHDLAHLSVMIERAVLPGELEYYAGIVKEKAFKRSSYNEILRLKTKIEHEEDLGSEGILEALRSSYKDLLDKSISTKSLKYFHVSELCEGFLEEVKASPDGIARNFFVKTGMKGFDVITGGLFPGFIIIAGRPSSGKTTLLTAICLNISAPQNEFEDGRPVIFFSYEVLGKMLLVRLLSQLGRIKSNQIMFGPTISLIDSVEKNLQRLSEHNLFLCEEPMNVANMTRVIEHVEERTGQVPVVAIDRLEIIPDRIKAGENKQNQIERLCSELNHLSITHKTPILCLVQMNRDCEKRSDPRPILSDLRGSGAIEQDAKMVLFVHRDKSENQAQKELGVPQKALIRIEKNMNGATGDVHLTFEDEIPCFFDLAAIEEKAQQCGSEEDYDEHDGLL